MKRRPYNLETEEEFLPVIQWFAAVEDWTLCPPELFLQAFCGGSYPICLWSLVLYPTEVYRTKSSQKHLMSSLTSASSTRVGFCLGSQTTSTLRLRRLEIPDLVLWLSLGS